ncbi:TRI12-domain-containing protein [Lentithecium fluviatile CBS 122367]|uniref:TRI12-domain-containing protein n=1 Tax=Lentithecium fluviatile CBS 122367 TaxID=1168545 RepID=A0A6G1JNJ5_9PLEO|nr:TRI12-domain-containing protein [Lentithecium fluviatile CBS 122367]
MSISHKPEAVMQYEDAPSSHHENVSNTVHSFTADEATVKKGYFRSSFFLGTMLATGLDLSAAVGGFGLAAPNLALINADIGPDPNITWVSLVCTLTLAIRLLLWFFIGSAALALIGCIVSAVANSVGMLIGGTTLIGLAASGQQSFAFITGEIVPMKHRFATNAVMYFFCIPFAGLVPPVSKAFVLYTASGWRWCYYLMIIVNFASGSLFFFFYFPPTFHEKFQNRSKRQQIRGFDYLGTVLFVVGFCIFLLGLSWGGSVYPWKSAHVIATMVSGGITLIIFVLWEMYAKLEEPLLPINLFKNFAWVVSCIPLGLGSSIYYALTIIWPQMVALLYTDDGGASMYAGWLACVPSLMINIGQIAGGFLAEPIGKTKIQCIVVLTIGGALLGAIAAATPDTKALSTGLLVLSTFFIGWNENVCLSNSGIELLDQREIGTAVRGSSIRSAISTISSAVYISVLTNRLTQTIPAEVPKAVTQAGLPASSVPAFILANSQAYSTVFYTTIAFTGIAVVLSFFSPNVDDKMTGKIAVTLHKGDADNVVSEKA